MNPTSQNSPFLPIQRNFIQKSQEGLSEVIDKSYVDIAQKMNDRVIGNYAMGSEIVTGEKYYNKGQPQTSKRQMYEINSTTSVPAPVPHNIVISQINQFTKMYGQYTDGTGNWYSLQAGTSVAVAGQLTFFLDPTNINFLSGAGAPKLIRGLIILEYTNL
jgi:hypothetical protein